MYRVRAAAGRLSWDDAIAQVAHEPRRSAAWRGRLTCAAVSENPLERLWAAVLRDAIEALRGWHLDSRGGQAVAQSAHAVWAETCAWVRDPALTPLGTFGAVCVVLDLDVDVVRRDLCALAGGASIVAPTGRLRRGTRTVRAA